MKNRSHIFLKFLLLQAILLASATTFAFSPNDSEFISQADSNFENSQGKKTVSHQQLIAESFRFSSQKEMDPVFSPGAAIFKISGHKPDYSLPKNYCSLHSSLRKKLLTSQLFPFHTFW